MAEWPSRNWMTPRRPFHSALFVVFVWRKNEAHHTKEGLQTLVKPVFLTSWSLPLRVCFQSGSFEVLSFCSINVFWDCPKPSGIFGHFQNVLLLLRQSYVILRSLLLHKNTNSQSFPLLKQHQLMQWMEYKSGLVVSLCFYTYCTESQQLNWYDRM